MKTLLLAAALMAPQDGGREEGLRLYREGRFAEAAAAFDRALANDREAADLEWNLALAKWRAGELEGAETAVEKYAALAEDARADLHRGLLGAIRFDQARRLEAAADAALSGAAPPAAAGDDAAPPDPLALLRQALERAQQATGHFVAAAASKPTPALQRNTERALAHVAALEKRIEELEKQQAEQSDGDPQEDPQQQQPEPEKKDDPPQEDEEKQDEPKQDEPKEDAEKRDEEKQDEPEEQQDGESSPDSGDPGEPGPGQKRPPNPDGEHDEPPEPAPQPQAGEDQTGEPAESDASDDEQPPRPVRAPRSDAPGEAGEGKELTPEQQQRLLQQLEKLDAELQRLRARSRSQRPRVERDW